MSRAAQTSGNNDTILSVQKAIESGKEVRYLGTACPKNPDSSIPRIIPGQLPIRSHKSGQHLTGMNWHQEGFPE
jgi:hypothetical protein